MVNIVGAGMAGLLCANMLSKHKPVVYEKQPDLPHNHSAVLRFRSSIVGDVLGIPFKQVMLIKAIEAWKNPIADALAYSSKCTNFYRSDRSILTSPTMAERFIAPVNMIPRMSFGIDVRYGIEYDFGMSEGPHISTIPMPALMAILDYPGAKEITFNWLYATNIRATIEACDAYVSLYVPDPARPFSRVSITGNELIVETPARGLTDEEGNKVARSAAMLLGIAYEEVSDIRVSQQSYGKILPISEEVRRDFVYWATEKHNVYSLGRFATWRPGLLLDDLVQDIRLIDKWISRRDRYAVAKK